MTGWVLHVDMDQFLAAIELLRRPELVGLPLVVGGRGDPTERAVVSTASYQARQFGIRSGMPLKTAYRRCPEAVFLPLDLPVYEAASAQVMETLRGFPGAVVEPLGWDEAFVGIDTDNPERTATALAQAVEDATALQCSIGIGDTTIRAKNATGFAKPHGIYRLTRVNWLEVMGEYPVVRLWGIGNRTRDRLATLGIHTVAELASAALPPLIEEFGPNTGPHIQRLGSGDGRQVVDDTPWVARAHGHETTFQHNLTTSDEVAQALNRLAEQVAADLRAEGRACQRVHLKVRFAPFFTVTRVRKLAEPTFSASTIADSALGLLQALGDERPIRLLGVRGEMVAPEGGYAPPRGHGRRGAP